ncbi:hypothetical protein J5N97_000208 [Dioscorea zingiberensis]|uniref:CRAL-TRIO domain-containing protein n=1 Tax=Dioscorea zingiberensis TaxID=325984 RepID=A0A9D5BSH6_9LILI|nr:hypothetical protein J5N97_000208 [Dioscorea zingiberensis]
MIKNAVIWRKTFGIEALLEEDLGFPEMEKDKDLYAKAFGDEEKRQKFLRWRIQFLEKGIRQQLDFSPSGVCTMVQVTDLKNSPGPGKRELRQATNQALALLQDNYPEFVAKQVFINVPWWYLAFNRMISPFLTQRTKSKFVLPGHPNQLKPCSSFRVPVQYGGLSKGERPDFTTAAPVTESIIKPSTRQTIEIPIGREPVVKNSFKTGETGKIVLTFENATSKKKKLLYRSKRRAPVNPFESSPHAEIQAETIKKKETWELHLLINCFKK